MLLPPGSGSVLCGARDGSWCSLWWASAPEGHKEQEQSPRLCQGRFRVNTGENFSTERVSSPEQGAQGSGGVPFLDRFGRHAGVALRDRFSGGLGRAGGQFHLGS